MEGKLAGRLLRRGVLGRLSAQALLEVHRRLRRHYGRRRRIVEREPVMDSLIGTILSQNTSDVNSGRAFEELKAAFPAWDTARCAPVRRIEKAIRCGGLARTKARRIREILERVHARRGVTSLDHLRGAHTSRIKEELGRLPGVGPKTIACVLLFNLGRHDFPVDTHIHRIARRLGWVSPRAGAEQLYELVNPLVPRRLTYELHVLLIVHGRRLCRSQNPRCRDCPLLELCPWGQRETEGGWGRARSGGAGELRRAANGGRGRIRTGG